MSRDRVAGIGFHHPHRNARPLTTRKIALAHLLMTAVLVICIVVAVTAVTFGMARAGTPISKNVALVSLLLIHR
ncbi:hypothetical protein [Pseudorhodoplanes sinuspersici]|uniref:Uncharacterized protein n=1 Tax=Pseudorhodoplanes sinuspersici TaxID=1235591 RepID=A0A1W6ZT68_9HYPH|nr:hypothetical protein [Pseudorhodoplanes sinuspersici]ARQ00478.1 hypothetical protein CAK95_16370 [Pseudorhodoplanes sinuspersici]RKE67345.1 hypothetical protein DFP91_5109 [Pseudorhodoplanes sinuspersici]